ncbi:hypothetical protein R1flu_006006 [Riccia fluitans]|uniref:C2HC zinc finger plants domain-containing protein n=1 Tax=Riccia fluitans TaxID=41844 RepID=A0ABD1YXT7_9MARC
MSTVTYDIGEQRSLEIESNLIRKTAKFIRLVEATRRVLGSPMEPDPVTVTENGRHEINMDSIASLLAIARQRINEGNPSLALQAIVVALRAAGGESAVFQAFSRAREVYHSQRQANSAVDELSALFADCGITDIQPLSVGTNGDLPMANGHAVPPGTHEMDMVESNVPRHENAAPILAESGRLQVVVDASTDGSSFVCVRCGGVVSMMRRDEHFQFWCSQATQ